MDYVTGNGETFPGPQMDYAIVAAVDYDVDGPAQYHCGASVPRHDVRVCNTKSWNAKR